MKALTNIAMLATDMYSHYRTSFSTSDMKRCLFILFMQLLVRVLNCVCMCVFVCVYVCLRITMFADDIVHGRTQKHIHACCLIKYHITTHTDSNTQGPPCPLLCLSV